MSRYRAVDPRLVAGGAAWATGALLLHKVGVLAGWYGTYPWFQNLTHAASASGVAILAGLFALHVGVGGRRAILAAVALTAAGALGWELVEYLGLLDPYGMYFHFHGFADASVDMASNAVGTAVAMVALWRWTDLEPVARRAHTQIGGRRPDRNE